MIKIEIKILPGGYLEDKKIGRLYSFKDFTTGERGKSLGKEGGLNIR